MMATSYPRDEGDWQGLFIREIASAAAGSPDIDLSLWAPNGPRHANISYACSPEDADWLSDLAQQGGIAHLMRTHPLRFLGKAGGLLKRLHTLYRRYDDVIDIYHINWLQNALPLYGMNARAVITVLGSDFKLLKLPGMVSLLRQVLKTNQCILAPNAIWMKPHLEDWFGDLADVQAVNFGIDDRWFQVSSKLPAENDQWICVMRVTRDKMGQLFKWGEDVFTGTRKLHLFGPNQDKLDIPPWVNYHGAVTATELVDIWYPKCVGFITLSEHSEGKPQVLLETLAAGMPVIASNIPAHQEIITQGRHGFLVNSAIEFREAVAQVSDSSKHRELSENCRNTSRRDYGTWRDCMARYKKLYGMLK